MGDRGHHNNEYDRIAPKYFPKSKCQGSHKGLSSCKDRQRGNRLGGFAGPGPRLYNNDGEATMRNSAQDSSSRHRYSPYGRTCWREDSHINRDWRRGKGGGGGRGRGGGSFREDPNGGRTLSRTGWFKITIPFGRKYDKNWLMPALQNLCSVPYTPIQYNGVQNRVYFYVDDSTAASALQKCSRKITDSDGHQVEVFVNSCKPPDFLLSHQKPEQVERLKQCMSKRFDVSQQALDLSNICTDPDLVSQKIEVILNKKTCMEAVIKIIEENISQLTCLNLSNNCIQRLNELSGLVTEVPHLKTLNLSHNNLKSELELDKLKGLKLVELWLLKNPLCALFKDQSSYISAVRQRFPQLLKLDGNDLPPPIGFDVGAPTAIPPCKGSHFVSDDIKVLIQNFLQQFYSVYDSENRQSLLEAYYDGASFSLTAPYNTQSPSRSSPGKYNRESRNLKTIKDSTMRFRLLKHTRLDVVSFLNELPKTKHDMASFTVDVNTYTNTLLSFTVSGVFKEVVVNSRESTMAFSRVFITIPAENSGLCIINDQLSIKMATTEQIRRAFVAPAPTPEPTLTSPEREMLTTFSQKSGMNLPWSKKCLQDNKWDFNRAAQNFIQLKTEGKIPDVAFLT